MNVQEQSEGTAARQPAAGKVLGEAILVAVIGALVALAANRISPRGLSLARDYFPQAKAVSASAPANTNTPQAQTETNEPAAPSETESAIARLKSKGLQVADYNEVTNLLHGPGYQTGTVIFIDARGEEYEAGHIPGAYEFDYYHPDKYLAAILPACQNATNIVVYCHGIDCQDSEMAALYLRDGGVPNEKLFVYSGGMTEWDEKKEPIETGARNSGQMLPTNK